MTNAKTYPHYFKPTPFAHADVYRVLSMWNVTNPAIQHAVKKLLASGERGTKDWRKDVAEARDSLQRALDIHDEDASLAREAVELLEKAKRDADRLCGVPTALDKAYADAVNIGIGWARMGVDFGADGKDVFASERIAPASVGVGTAEHKAAQEAANVRAAKAIDAAIEAGIKRAKAAGQTTRSVDFGPGRGFNIYELAQTTATKHEPRYFGSVDAKDARGHHGRYLASLAASDRVSSETFTERVLECIGAGAKTVELDHGRVLSIDGFELSDAQRQDLGREMKRRRCTWSWV